MKSLSTSVSELSAAYQRALKTHRDLTREQEKELAVRMRQGDREARDRLFKCNLKLVLSHARHYLNRGLPTADIIQEGHIGLLKALDKYDPERGYRLSAYADWWIWSTIKRSIVNNARTIHIPFWITPLLNRYLQMVWQFRSETGRDPSDSKVAEELGVEDLNLIATLRDAGHVTSSFGVHGEHREYKALAPESFIPDALERSDTVTRLLTLVDDRERRILSERFGLRGETPLTLREIGDHLGISYERVRQIEERALKKIRQKIKGTAEFRYGWNRQRS